MIRINPAFSSFLNALLRIEDCSLILKSLYLKIILSFYLKSVMYKIVHNHVDIDHSLSFRTDCRLTRWHNFKIFIVHSRTDTRKNLYLIRMSHRWNSISASLAEDKSFLHFKKCIRSLDLVGVRA
jgi:hypothetical protein